MTLPADGITLRRSLAARLPRRLARLPSLALLARVSGAFAIRTTGAALAFASQVAMARWMGIVEFGLYTTAWVWVLVLGTLCQLGLNVSGTRFAALYRENGRPWRLRALAGFSSLAAVLAGLAVAAAGLGVSVVLDADAPGHLALWIGLAAVPLFALHEVAKGLTRGLAGVARAYVPGFVMRPALLLAALALLYWVGAAPGAAIAMGATLATLLLVVLYQWGVLHRLLPARARLPRPTWHARHWLLASLPVLLVDGQYILLSHLDVLVVGAFLDPEAVAVYFAAARVVALVSFIHFAISAVSAQPIARLDARGDRAALADIARRLTWLDFALTLAAALGVVTLGGPILALFGEGFGAGRTAMTILVLGLLAQAAFGPVRYLLTMTGQQNAMAVVLTVTSALNVALALVLVPRFGLEGAAVATSASLAASCLALAVVARRRLGFWPVIGG